MNLSSKVKKVYFITPVANYLDIKGEKRRTRVKIDRNKRETIFDLVDQLSWTGFDQTKDKETGTRYYVIEIFNTDHLIDNFKASEESLPADFKDLYDTIRE